MVRMKLGVSQKQASKYASPAAANTLRKSKPGDPIAQSTNTRKTNASASAATQFVNVISASTTAAAANCQKRRPVPAAQSAITASGSSANPALCGPSPYFTNTCNRHGSSVIPLSR